MMHLNRVAALALIAAAALAAGCHASFSSSTPATTTSTQQQPLFAMNVADTPSVPGVWIHHGDGRIDSTLLRNMLGAVASPDGRTIAAIFLDSTRHRLARLIMQDGSDDTITVAEPGWVVGPGWPAWSPDGDSVAFMLQGRTEQSFGRPAIAIVDVERRVVTRRIVLPAGVLLGGYDALVKSKWSPDGRGFYYCGIHDCLITNLSTNRTIRAPAVALDWSADGRSIIYFALRSNTRISTVGGFYSRVPGDSVARTVTDSVAVYAAGIRPFPFLMEMAIDVSPSGKKLAVAAGGTRGDSIGLRIYTANASNEFDITRPDTTYWMMAVPFQLKWSRDEKAIAAAIVSDGHTYELIDVATGKRRVLAHLHVKGVAVMFIGAIQLLGW